MKKQIKLKYGDEVLIHPGQIGTIQSAHINGHGGWGYWVKLNSEIVDEFDDENIFNITGELADLGSWYNTKDLIKHADVDEPISNELKERLMQVIQGDLITKRNASELIDHAIFYFKK